VKAEKDAGISAWIADDKTRKKLTVRGEIAHSSKLHGLPVEPRRLEEDLLLGSPKKSH
jgi:hypothetical protein